MLSRPHIVVRTSTLSVLLVYLVLTGCHSSSEISAPTIAFSKVPATDQGSPFRTDTFELDYKTDIVEGRVTGARPGQRIVLYAKTDGRWGRVPATGYAFNIVDAHIDVALCEVTVLRDDVGSRGGHESHGHLAGSVISLAG
jgi:hypothetical protein